MSLKNFKRLNLNSNKKFKQLRILVLIIRDKDFAKISKLTNAIRYSVGRAAEFSSGMVMT